MTKNFKHITVQNSAGQWVATNDKEIMKAVETHVYEGTVTLAKKITVGGIPAVIFSVTTLDDRSMFVAYLNIGNNTFILNTMIRSIMAENDNAWHARVSAANEKLFS